MFHCDWFSKELSDQYLGKIEYMGVGFSGRQRNLGKIWVHERHQQETEEVGHTV